MFVPRCHNTRPLEETRSETDIIHVQCATTRVKRVVEFEVEQVFVELELILCPGRISWLG